MDIIEFFSHPVFIVASGISILIFIFKKFHSALYFLFETWPIWTKLGMGLSTRKIAIFAEDKYSELKAILVDSGMFKEKNIIRIHSSDIKKAADITFMLVHWESFNDRIDVILSVKKDSDALIVYAPSEDGRLTVKEFTKINSERNTILVNFRGRLLNDIISSMITTSFSK